MPLPKVVYYTPGAVVLTFKRGPQNFTPYWDARVHDNLATSGTARERVLEQKDLLVEFDMDYLLVDDDLQAWDTAMQNLLDGNQFDFYPNVDINEWYHLVYEGKQFRPAFGSKQRYRHHFEMRVIRDVLFPVGGAAQVLRRFHGFNP